MVLDRRVDILALEEISPKEWRWKVSGRAWAQTERQKGNNLFSRVGLGAASMLFRMHPRTLTLHNALRWDGRHFFPTAIDRVSPVLLEVSTAEVVPIDCRAFRPQVKLDANRRRVYDAPMDAIAAFPAVLTEKYLGAKLEEVHTEITATFVLVTSKVAELEVNDLVEAAGRRYAVQACHTLDPFKNEYEITRKEDA